MGNSEIQQEEFIKRINDAQGIIHKVCRMYCDDEIHRQDLFQEILIQLWTSYPSYDGRSKFSSWMFRVALNVALQDLDKTKKKRRLFLSTDAFADISEEKKSLLPEEKLKKLRHAIAGLNKVEKAIIMLHLEEKSNEEIAEIVGITQNYVRVRMNRIKQKLKKKLNP